MAENPEPSLPRSLAYFLGGTFTYLAAMLIGISLTSLERVDALQSSWFVRNIIGLWEGAPLRLVSEHRVWVGALLLGLIALTRLAGGGAVSSLTHDDLVLRPSLRPLFLQAIAGFFVGLLAGAYVETVYSLKNGVSWVLAWRLATAIPGLGVFAFVLKHRGDEVAEGVVDDALDQYVVKIVGRAALLIAVAFASLLGLGDDHRSAAAAAPLPSDPVLLEGEALHSGEWITSPDRRFKLIVQAGDGNVVLYGPDGAMWTPNIRGASSLILQTDGNLVAYRGDTALWSTTTSGQNVVKLLLQDDGNLVLYGPSAVPVWSSQTSVTV